MPTNFHRETFELLGIEPQVSQESASTLARTEKNHGFTLPPSVKEWYSLEGAVEIMKVNSNGDHFTAVTDLGWEGHPSAEGDDWQSMGLLWFATENQGVCYWAVRLDSSDDPEVLVRVDGRDGWQCCADHFTTFVWSLVFDWRHKDDHCLCAQAAPLTDADLSYLSAHFQTAPKTTAFPGDVNYRFHRDDQRILIWAGPGQADWHLWAQTPSTLDNLAGMVWGCSNLSTSLYALDEDDEKILRRRRTSTK